MTTILKSELYYQGSAVLPALSTLTYGYSHYAARVVADGGVIIDAAATEDAFDFLIAAGIDPGQCGVIGASFGIKESAGAVSKMYSFDGNDFIPSSGVDGPYFDDTGAYPVIRVDGGVNFRYLKSTNQRPLMAPGATGFCMAMCGANDVADDSLYMVVSGGPDGSANYATAALFGYNNDYAISRYDAAGQDSAYDTAVLAAGTIETANGPAYAGFLGLAAHYNTSSAVISTYGDGVASGTKTAAPAMYAGYSTLPVRLYLSGNYAGAVGAFKKQRYTEFWVVRDATAAFALSLSARLGTLY